MNIQPLTLREVLELPCCVLRKRCAEIDAQKEELQRKLDTLIQEQGLNRYDMIPLNPPIEKGRFC